MNFSLSLPGWIVACTISFCLSSFLLLSWLFLICSSSLVFPLSFFLFFFSWLTLKYVLLKGRRAGINAGTLLFILHFLSLYSYIHISSSFQLSSMALRYGKTF